MKTWNFSDILQMFSRNLESPCQAKKYDAQDKSETPLYPWKPRNCFPHDPPWPWQAPQIFSQVVDAGDDADDDAFVIDESWTQDVSF